MAENEIRDGIREGLEPLGGLIQDMAIERRQWLSTLVSNRSILQIRLIEGGKVTGVYLSHDEKTLTVSNTTKMEVVGWMQIDGIDQLA